MPDPEGPTIPTVSPLPISSETPCRISTGPALLCRVRETVSRAIAGLVTSGRSALRGVAETHAVFRGIFKAAAFIPLAFAPAQAADDPVRVVVFGDSLAAGYGLLPAEGFTAQLQNWAEAELETPVAIENAGVSGDTTAGGLARLSWTLGDYPPDAVIVELGGNDALRGINPAETKSNLAKILAKLTAADIHVLLAGMLAPRNMGADYAAEFEAIYPALAEDFDVVYLPFFLEGVAGERDLNQADGIHPNAEGVKKIVAHIAPQMRDLITRAAQ